LSQVRKRSDFVGRVEGSLVTRWRVPHPLDLIALVLGILFTLRQMDVAQRQAPQFPHVRAADFTRWWQLARGSYRLGATACFAKILLDIAAAYWMRHALPPAAARWTVGLTLDLGWVVLVGVAWFRSRRAHALARDLGIEVRARSAES
jgi:hypothetical protein